MPTQRYRVTFQVDRDVNGECWWETDASSPEEARDLAIVWFESDRWWAQHFPVTPTCIVQAVGPPTPNADGHGDQGPIRGLVE